jgi:hypothetical protein
MYGVFLLDVQLEIDGARLGCCHPQLLGLSTSTFLEKERTKSRVVLNRYIASCKT